MPNHVINEIILHGIPLERARPYLVNADGEVSFAVLLPLPLNFWPSSVGSAEQEAFPGTWLDAARATWGTKWDAYGGPEALELDGDTVITFQSAWAHPRGWTCALFNTLQCPITAKWLDEGASHGRCEQYTRNDDALGDRWTSELIEAGTPEHRRLHKLLWGVEAFEEETDA